jgi:hypothetical protein
MFADGSVQIVDRIKDVIKTGGEWVSYIGLESLIGDVAGVQEAAVIGVKDEKWGNGRWRSSSVSPTRRSTQTRSAPTCSLWSNQTASASTRCRPHRLRRRNPEDERRQDRQEGAARAQRVTTAGRLRAGRSGPGAHRVARTASPPPRI